MSKYVATGLSFLAARWTRTALRMTAKKRERDLAAVLGVVAVRLEVVEELLRGALQEPLRAHERVRLPGAWRGAGGVLWSPRDNVLGAS